MSSNESPQKRSNWVPFLLVGAAMVYLLLVAMRGGGGSGREHVGVGGEVTDVTFAALTAENGTSSDEWAGNVVLINFWGTWCPPCRKEFPHIVQIHRRFESEEDFRLVSVSCPSDAIKMDQFHAATSEYVDRSGAAFVTYYDAIGRSKRRILDAAQLSSGGIPITVVLDRSGVIRGVWQGFQLGDEREMEMLVAELLASGQSTSEVADQL